jgi:hypothetical protein
VALRRQRYRERGGRHHSLLPHHPQLAAAHAARQPRAAAPYRPRRLPAPTAPPLPAAVWRVWRGGGCHAGLQVCQYFVSWGWLLAAWGCPLFTCSTVLPGCCKGLQLLVPTCLPVLIALPRSYLNDLVELNTRTGKHACRAAQSWADKAGHGRAGQGLHRMPVLMSVACCLLLSPCRRGQGCTLHGHAARHSSIPCLCACGRVLLCGGRPHT